MPVSATPTTPQVITLDDVRGFMRDVAGQIPGTNLENVLFDVAPEFSDADINRAIKFTVARFNIITPLSNDDQYSINPWLLLMGTCELLAMSEAFRQTRNQVSYTDGEQPIGLDDKQSLYLSIAQLCKAEFEEKVKNFKVARNMESCYGSLGSGYRNVSRFHHTS